MKHYVYKIINIINGKIYIGKHSSTDINRDSYLGSGVAIAKAIKKYGRQNFTRQILYQCDYQEDALNLQRILVDEQFILRNDNYNIVQGGRSGWKSGTVSVNDKQGNFLRINSAQYFSNKSNYTHPTKGRITVIDSDGKIISILKNSYEALNNQYLSINKGKVIVKDCNGNIKRIPTQQFYNTPSQYKHLNKGKVLAKTINNEIISIDHQQFVKDDTIVGINYGKATVKDKNGRTFQVSKNDERFVSGQVKGVLSKKCIKRSLKTGQTKVFGVQEDIPQQFVGINHNLIRVKDKYGFEFFVSKDDSRVETGQLLVWSKNTVTVKDGNITKRISIFDERYKNGEVTPENKGKILVRNDAGSRTTMYKTDSRYVSGEYYPITKNMLYIHSTELHECKLIDKQTPLPCGWKVGSGKIFIFNKDTKQRRKIYIWQEIPTGFSKGMK